jgi:hypothetical protein
MWLNLNFYPLGIYLEGLKKTRKYVRITGYRAEV